ncbi:MAG: transketolase C-terminal domain-containing protein, partial [Sporomusaceae bacterium]|nr:transketolase C-terminal domain-containing protein [Sporomusaceae bacterium]
HDSIAVGEDGPTHEPVEQLAAFRAMPNLNVIRPADGNETRIAWQIALESEKTPTALVLSRQDLLVQPADSTAQEAGVRSGAYVLAGCDNPAALILASGSEVELAMAARDALIAENISVNVISFPSWHLFAKQPKEYKEKVLPPNVKARVAVEMGSSLGWERYTGDAGSIIAIDSFGASAPAETVLAEYGFTVERVVAAVKALL